MSDSQRLAVVRAVHTVIYFLMATSTLALLYAGVTGARGVWLWIALALLAAEAVAFTTSGLQCPLSVLAVRYGARSGHVLGSVLPERVTHYDFRFFGTLVAIGLVLLGARWTGFLG